MINRLSADPHGHTVFECRDCGVKQAVGRSVVRKGAEKDLTGRRCPQRRRGQLDGYSLECLMAAHEVRWRDDCVVVWVRRVVLILIEDVVSVGVERITEYLVARSAEGRRVAVEPHTRTDVVELTVEVEVTQYRERVRVDHEVDADSEVYASQKLVAQYDRVPVRIVRLVGRRSDKYAFDLLTVEKRADEILEARSAFANLHLGLCQYAWDRGHKVRGKTSRRECVGAS